MNMNPQIRAFLMEKHGLKADATEQAAKALLASLVAKGAVKSSELSALKQKGPDTGDLSASITKTASSVTVATASAGTITREEVDTIAKGAVESVLKARSGTFESLVGGSAYSVYGVNHEDVRVKNPLEQFDGSRKAAIAPIHTKSGTPHPLAGTHVGIGTDLFDHPSHQDIVKWGAWFKFMLSSSVEQKQLPQSYRMTDLDHQVVKQLIHEDRFSGKLKARGNEEGGIDVYRRALNDYERKALLDDAISGGIEIAPAVFDDMIVTFPLLYGELFPRVKVVPLSNGRRVKSAKLNLPTLTSGTVEGQPITPYDTSAFISAFDTPIYNAVGALEYGMDLEEDSPVAFGGHILDAYQRRALEWLDRVIPMGDGVKEPLGIFNTPGVQAVGSIGGAGGPLYVTDAEELQFGVAKQYRFEGGAKPVFVSNDTMYKRFRKIQVGVGDQRRVFGMDHQKYNLLDSDYAIQNDIPNGKVGFFNPQRYRMYRRLGIQVRVETAGRSLALSNSKVIVVRMRYGGQAETGAAIATMTDAWA